MTEEKILLQLKHFANENGLENVDPIILNESANLVIHLYPYNIVARIALYDSNTSHMKDVMQKEIEVANYLEEKGIAVVSSNSQIIVEPFDLGGHWMTLWNFVRKEEREKLTSFAAIQYVEKLTNAMKRYDGKLPILGVWKRVHESAKNLSKSDNSQIQRLVENYNTLNEEISNIEVESLVPSHGDSHVKNLYPAKTDWLWMDFEDASLMPEYWDWASFLANMALFNGLNIPIVQQVVENKEIIKNKNKFFTVLKARILMSIIGNLDLALQGLGDLEYAELQLENYEKLLKQIDDYNIQ
ncbi:hypothetical protein ACR6HW_16885 [Fusibacter sp. JL298sf-3]